MYAIMDDLILDGWAGSLENLRFPSYTVS